MVGYHNIVIGDFNIDFSCRSKDAGKIRLKDMVVKYMNSGTLTVIISDHLPIFIQKKMKRPHHPKAKTHCGKIRCTPNFALIILLVSLVTMIDSVSTGL